MATHSSILAWQIPWTEDLLVTVHGVAKSRTWQRNFHFHFKSKRKLNFEMWALVINCWGFIFINHLNPLFCCCLVTKSCPSTAQYIYMCVCVCACVHTHVLVQSCPTLCDPMNCSQWGSSVHGILQERILEWVAISYSRGSSQSWDWTHGSCVSCIADRFHLLSHRGSPCVCVCVEVSMVEVLEPIPKDTEGCSHIHVQLHTHMCTHIYACTPLHNKNNGTACLKNHRWFLRFERDSKVYLEKSPRMFFAKHE